MAFKVRKMEANDFSTPQEMFQDNKLKSIKGILDYQSQILDHYLTSLNGTQIADKNVAFELPTGSGKTLVGILIAEFHRRKFNRKCLFLCPTNQLVSQVCEQANNSYGIEAIPFIGKQADYDISAKTKYTLRQAIGVTTYSSFFAMHSYFEDPDILIFDDVHSSENYIIDNWSLDIDRENNTVLFHQVAALLADIIGDSGMSRLMSKDPFSDEIMEWNDLLPHPLLMEKIPDLQKILSAGTKDTNLKYAWSRIADNLEDCQIYISWHSILIRPYIPPTETQEAFNNSAQRVFMSATLGKSGELERLTGCKRIRRLPIVSGWDTKGLGRRLFIFPDLSFGTKKYGEILIRLHEIAGRSVIIVPSGNDADEISKFLTSNIDEIEIYTANDLIASKESYCKSDNAAVVMANRFDGIDFPDDESRMLFIYNLPKITHLQEKFFVSKMAASLLYSERIKTRIVQAVGRCTRNASDYSVVCVLGNSVLNDITSEKAKSSYHPEMRAEIEFGIENSMGLEDVEAIFENVQLFFERGEGWAGAETEIVRSRNQFVTEGVDTEQEKLFAKLMESAEIEVDVQYALWKKDYQAALEKAARIVEILNAPSLTGYKCFWQYMCGCLALKLGDSSSSKKYLTQANNNNRGSIRWFPSLIKTISASEERVSETDSFYDVVESMEANLLKLNKNDRFETRVKDVLNGLFTGSGEIFEKAHLELGKLLGYDAHNSDITAAPDPYWIISDGLCIVAEDKIYESDEKEIPVEHVTQATRHETWIRANVERLRKDARIITVFVSNSSKIEATARTFGKDIYYVHRNDLFKWATGALNDLRTVRSWFQEVGDANWRERANEQFKGSTTTPQDFVEFVTRKRLSEL